MTHRASIEGPENLAAGWCLMRAWSAKSLSTKATIEALTAARCTKNVFPSTPANVPSVTKIRHITTTTINCEARQGDHLCWNLTWCYLYRDASNCKQASTVIFRNPEMLDDQEITERLRASLDEDGWFIADQINIPESFLFPRYEVSENDHCWHEFSHVEATDSEPTDPRTITEFLTEVERAAAVGWRVFDPIQREALRASLTKNAETAKEEAAA